MQITLHQMVMMEPMEEVMELMAALTELMMAMTENQMVMTENQMTTLMALMEAHLTVNNHRMATWASTGATFALAMSSSAQLTLTAQIVDGHGLPTTPCFGTPTMLTADALPGTVSTLKSQRMVTRDLAGAQHALTSTQSHVP